MTKSLLEASKDALALLQTIHAAERDRTGEHDMLPWPEMVELEDAINGFIAGMEEVLDQMQQMDEPAKVVNIAEYFEKYQKSVAESALHMAARKQIVDALGYWKRDMDMAGFESTLSAAEIDALIGSIEKGELI